MTDQELVSAVLESVGKRYDDEHYYLTPAIRFRLERLLTSRDAVWEVLGLDKIEDGYIICLCEVVLGFTGDERTICLNYKALSRLHKATCPQLLEAWLTWKKGQHAS